MVLFDHLHSSYLPPTSTSSNLQRLLKFAIIKTNNDDDHPDNGNISFAIIRTYSKGQSSFIEWSHLKVYTLLKKCLLYTSICNIGIYSYVSWRYFWGDSVSRNIIKCSIYRNWTYGELVDFSQFNQIAFPWMAQLFEGRKDFYRT